MPVADYYGDTFVAFTDISGFKEMMIGDGAMAIKALDELNKAGFNALSDNPDINGFFISDCGVLFVKNNSLNKSNKLKALLKVITIINRKLLNKNYILTTSIAYGEFSYHQRIEFPGIEKNPIYGNAYVTAFLDNESGKPKIQPGQCRIVVGDLEDEILDVDAKLKKTNKHLYYYWMVESNQQIDEFEKQYNDSYQLKYSGMLSALKMRTG